MAKMPYNTGLKKPKKPKKPKRPKKPKKPRKPKGNVEIGEGKFWVGYREGGKRRKPRGK